MKKPQAGWRPKRTGTKKWEAKGVNPLTGARKSYWGESKQEAEDKAYESFGFAEEASDTLYGFYANQYLPMIVRRSQNWRDQVAWAMDGYVIPRFGDTLLAEISRADAQRWFNTLGKKLKPSSIQKVKIVFSGVLNLAEDDEIIAKNPVRRVRLPRVEEPDKTALTFQELNALIEASQPCITPFIILCGCCGLRAGEATGVRRNAVRNGILSVRRQVIQVRGGALDTETLKTPQSKRQIPMPQGMRDALEVGQVSSIWFCSNNKGGYMLPNNSSRELEAAIIKADIQRITPHELRHTFISLMENELGCPRAIVAQLAGKKEKGSTADYSHAHMSQMKTWMEKFWEKVSTSTEDESCLPSAKIVGASEPNG